MIHHQLLEITDYALKRYNNHGKLVKLVVCFFEALRSYFVRIEYWHWSHGRHVVQKVNIRNIQDVKQTWIGKPFQVTLPGNAHST